MMNCQKMNNEQYYCNYEKHIRDVVHEYIELTEIDIAIIDTKYFQRLRDIKQLTFRYVYITANHTRFEHSLGVMHLTREAIKHLKRKCGAQYNLGDTSWKELWFQGGLAALFHDIGHLPLSHLGEEIFQGIYSESEQKRILYDKLEMKIHDINATLSDENKIFWENGKQSEYAIEKMRNHKAIHELFSCYVFLSYYVNFLKRRCFVNYDLIVRAILGIGYEDQDKNWPYNIVISLINSNSIDMDKLDYIMRDSIYCKLNTASIDSKRLFCNITVHQILKTVTYEPGAVSVLQNIIEARDALYMYVYNHHTAIFSDFIIFYLCDSLNKRYVNCNHSCKQDSDYMNYSGFTCIDLKDIFSLDAIMNDLVTDNEIYTILRRKYVSRKKALSGGMAWCDTCRQCDEKSFERRTGFIDKMATQVFERKYLKPIWKNIHEFNEFIDRNYNDDSIKNILVERICDSDATFRKELALGIASSSECNEFGLTYGDFLIIPRMNKFYSLDVIDDIYVYIKENEIISTKKQTNRNNHLLSTIIPPRNYHTLYKEKSFFVFVRDDKMNEKKQQMLLNERIVKALVRISKEMVLENNN